MSMVAFLRCVARGDSVGLSGAVIAGDRDGSDRGLGDVRTHGGEVRGMRRERRQNTSATSAAMGSDAAAARRTSAARASGAEPPASTQPIHVAQAAHARSPRTSRRRRATARHTAAMREAASCRRRRSRSASSRCTMRAFGSGDAVPHGSRRARGRREAPRRPRPRSDRRAAALGVADRLGDGVVPAPQPA